VALQVSIQNMTRDRCR